MIAIEHEMEAGPLVAAGAAGGGVSMAGTLVVLVFLVGAVMGGRYLAHQWGVTFPGGLLREATDRLVAWPARSTWVLRRRFNHALTSQRMVYPSGKEEAFQRLTLRLAPQDTLRLTPCGDLDAFSKDAAVTYTRHAQRSGWVIPPGGVWVRIVTDVNVRPGRIRPALPVAGRVDSPKAGWADADATDPDVLCGSGSFIGKTGTRSRPAPSGEFARDDAVTAPAPAVMLTLDIVGLGDVVVRDQVTVGRGRHCQVQLDSRHVSREHASLYPTGDGWWVVDLGSMNKTLLEGRALLPHQPRRILKGTTIEFGGRTGVRAVVLSSRTDPDMTTPHHAGTPAPSGRDATDKG